MTEPLEWVDAAACLELPLLRARGESQELEYMVAFPTSVRDLAKEIAAFASTNAGTILVGVADNGDLVGLSDLDDPLARDRLISRVEALCHGPIQPSITPSACFAIEEGKLVLVLRIPRGNQPIYYCQHVPYIRHLTQARPARPNEVVDRVAQWLSIRPQREEPLNDFYGELVTAVREILLWADEVEVRRVNPWIETIRSVFELKAKALRQLSVSDSALELGLSDRLEALAERADAAATHRMLLGRTSWEEFLGKVAEVRETAAELKRDAIDPLEIDDTTRQGALHQLQQTTRELESVSLRLDRMVEQGRVQELQTLVANLGRNVLRVSYWGLDRGPAEIVNEVQRVGRELHALETLRITPGGTETSQLLGTIKAGAERLRSLVVELDG